MGGCGTQPFTTLLSPCRQILQEGAESSLRHLLIEASAGRVDNITMVMGLHPQYLSSFWKTQSLLLRMDGPLPYHTRHYIAIMVSLGDPQGRGVVPWGRMSSQHLCWVFARRWEGVWDPTDGPRGLEAPLGLVCAHPGRTNIPPRAPGTSIDAGQWAETPTWTLIPRENPPRVGQGGGISLPWLLQGLVAGLWDSPGWCWALTAQLSPQAAARHRCSYLVGLHREEFLQVGGNPAWLQGLHCAPQKLRNLSEINKLLAHRPWLVTKEHIEVRVDAASADSLPPTPKPGTPPCTDPPGFTHSGLRGSLSWGAGSMLVLMDGEGMT